MHPPTVNVRARAHGAGTREVLDSKFVGLHRLRCAEVARLLQALDPARVLASTDAWVHCRGLGARTVVVGLCLRTSPLFADSVRLVQMPRRFQQPTLAIEVAAASQFPRRPDSQSVVRLRHSRRSDPSSVPLGGLWGGWTQPVPAVASAQLSCCYVATCPRISQTPVAATGPKPAAKKGFRVRTVVVAMGGGVGAGVGDVGAMGQPSEAVPGAQQKKTSVTRGGDALLTAAPTAQLLPRTEQQRQPRQGSSKIYCRSEEE
eukprot:INCI17545.2.p2 GENE.INCI17545.2~~INCI17545.2.p2  ORF type:complete len:260 (-),score=31.12 INCI17545.2:88-867(-)